MDFDEKKELERKIECAVNGRLIKVKQLDERAVLPKRGTEFSAGADLYVITDEHQVVVSPGKTVFFHTGLSFEIPTGYVGLIFARSGMACKQDLAPANKTAVIDSDFRGEVMIALHNHGTEPKVVHNGDRVAQLVIVPYFPCEYYFVDELSDTERGAGGFGSTGVN